MAVFAASFFPSILLSTVEFLVALFAGVEGVDFVVMLAGGGGCATVLDCLVAVDGTGALLDVLLPLLLLDELLEPPRASFIGMEGVS